MRFVDGCEQCPRLRNCHTTESEHARRHIQARLLNDAKLEVVRRQQVLEELDKKIAGLPPSKWLAG